MTESPRIGHSRGFDRPSCSKSSFGQSGIGVGLCSLRACLPNGIS
jgi:hypothetical protein